MGEVKVLVPIIETERVDASAAVIVAEFASEQLVGVQFESVPVPETVDLPRWLHDPPPEKLTVVAEVKVKVSVKLHLKGVE